VKSHINTISVVDVGAVFKLSHSQPIPNRIQLPERIHVIWNLTPERIFNSNHLLYLFSRWIGFLWTFEAGLTAARAMPGFDGIAGDVSGFAETSPPFAKRAHVLLKFLVFFS